VIPPLTTTDHLTVFAIAFSVAFIINYWRLR